MNRIEENTAFAVICTIGGALITINPHAMIFAVGERVALFLLLVFWASLLFNALFLLISVAHRKRIAMNG